jgi:hypothetical protein
LASPAGKAKLKPAPNPIAQAAEGLKVMEDAISMTLGELKIFYDADVPFVSLLDYQAYLRRVLHEHQKELERISRLLKQGRSR